MQCKAQYHWHRTSEPYLNWHFCVFIWGRKRKSIFLPVPMHIDHVYCKLDEEVESIGLWLGKRIQKTDVNYSNLLKISGFRDKERCHFWRFLDLVCFPLSWWSPYNLYFPDHILHRFGVKLHPGIVLVELRDLHRW